MTFDVTIRDLLTHTAGLMTRAGTGQPAITIGPNESLADVLPRLGCARRHDVPGPQECGSDALGAHPDSLPGRTAGEGYGLGVRVVTDRAVRNTAAVER